MIFKRITVFRFFGFDVRADASWIFLSVLISWTLATKAFPSLAPGLSADAYQWMGIAALVLLIFSIIAHEVAHAVIAEYYDMPIVSITLFVFGGVAEMKGEPSHPKGEFFMAVAGPIMSALLGLFFWATADFYGRYFAQGPIEVVLRYMGDLNMLLALFNMVPAFPLDGGRALRAVIWGIKNNLVLATRIASEAGAVFAYGLMAWACYKITQHDDLISGVWFSLLGLFVHAAGQYAVRQIESRSLLAQESVMRFAHSQFTSVTPDMTVRDFVENFVSKHYQKSFPVLDRGQLIGVVLLQRVLQLDRHKWHWLHVASVMEEIRLNVNSVSVDGSAADALDLMQRLRKDSLMVVDGSTLRGIIEYSDLITYLSITMKIDNNKPVEKSR